MTKHTNEQTFKSNDNRSDGNFILPLPPTDKLARSEMEIYARFMRHLRMVPNSRMEIKILSAIQFTADMLDIADEYVAKTLVDLGLKGTRKSLPSSYLEFVDRALMRSGMEYGAPSTHIAELRKHWDLIGEDKFAAFQYKVDTVEETVFIET